MIKFDLPQDLIAQSPARPRDSARLLVYDRQDKKITDTVFKDLDKYLPKDTTLVLNNSKVEHCRWLFNNDKVEIFTLSKLDTQTIQALVRPGRKFKLGLKVELCPNIFAEVIAIEDSGIRTLRLNVAHDSVILKKYEHVPLPPYIKQDDTLAKEYQTIYAKPEGSKAAPTAGLHFTESLLNSLRKNHSIAEITLHVGLGTFASLTQQQLDSGKLHSEYYSIDDNNLKLIKDSTHITSVGTTTTRTLESLIGLDASSTSGWTDILIKPGYKFKHTNALITNFHLPETSLLLLVEAFVGSNAELQKIYNHAIEQRYRFYSFGDAMLIK